MLTVTAGVSLADWPAPQAGTMPFYWVDGYVTNPTELAGRPVILYAQTFDPALVITAEVDQATGHFRFNAYDLYFYHKNDNYIEVGGKPIFVVAVARQTSSDLGSQEILSADWNKGFVRAELTLVQNGGPLNGTGAVAGNVKDYLNNNIFGAGIFLGSTKVATTDSSGNYLSDPLDPIASTVIACNATGFQPQYYAISVEANKVTWVNFSLGEAVPSGTVPLFISRAANGNDLEITWEAQQFGDPQIYIMMGDGNGSYTNTFGVWTRIASSGLLDAIAASLGDFAIESGKLTHRSQVGAGTSEAYYKAVVAALDMNEPANIPTFEAAWAVGKENIGINRVGAIGWNLIANPFKTRDIKDALFGNFSAADEIKIFDEGEKIFTSNPMKFNAVSGTWSTSDFIRGKGYWLYRSTPDPITATLVGDVSIKPLDVTITRNGANGWNFVGLPFAKSQTFAQFGPQNAADTDEFKIMNEETKIIAPTYKKAEWGAQSLLTGKGYLYYRSLPAPLTWNITIK